MHTRTALALLATLAVPLALASGTTYVGPGAVSAEGNSAGLLILCDPGVGVSGGGGCDFACATTCAVTVADATGAPAAFMACDWDGSNDVNCEDAAGSVVHASATGVIDVFVYNGVLGTITVE